MPVTTRRQSQHAKHLHSLSHQNLNNLPAEIVDEIAHHLNPNPEDGYHSDFSDVSYDRMSVTSAFSDMDEPKVKVMPCCRPGDEEVRADDASIPILDDRSTFSATSRRMRDVVFNRRQTRRRTIRYCDRWKEETMQLSEATRSRYTNLRILANKRHTVDPDGGQMLSFISCFPQVENLSISWSICETDAARSARFALKPTSTPFDGLPHLRRLHIVLHMEYPLEEAFPIRKALNELLNLMDHLRLLHVRDLGIFFGDYIDSDLGQEEFQYLYTVLRAMKFPQLESFHFAFILVALSLPAFDVWTAIEQLADSVLEATPAIDISLKIRLDLGGNDSNGVDDMLPVFTRTGDDMTMHPAYLPSLDTLVALVRRIKARHPRLKTFKLAIGWSVDVYVSKDSVFEFEYLEPTADEDGYEPQNTRDHTGLRNQQDGTDTSQFRYTVYPEVIKACYDELMKEAAEFQARGGQAVVENRIEAVTT